MLPMLYQGLRPYERRRQADAALDRVGLGERRHAYPTTLSGGEAQRVAIARAIAMEPEVLLCDEPTGNLDAETTEQIVATLEDLHRAGMTVVIVTHDPDVAARASRSLRLADGVLTEVQSIGRR